MARYIQFTASDGTDVLVEVEPDEVASAPGVVKAGLRETAQKAVAQAQATFEDALQRVLVHNAEALVEAVEHLPSQPETVEVTFGLKATGEVGNFAISKAGGEANFTIKLVWKPGATRSLPK